jgi:adenine-specific DNA-methyltransferase
MSQKYQKLRGLLKELFQLDQPDLDFGLYRIMHARSDEVTQFLDRDLLPQVKEAFSHYKTADKAELEKDLAKAIEQAQALGADPEPLPKVKELRARLADESVDVGALESEVYDHLYSFFRRYYSEGDFISLRRYKEGVYAIPYEGEEVKLHWANADQYYIKTSEYLRDYAFRLRPESETKPMRVHFRLTDAAEGEHGNVKEAEGKNRVFILAAADFIVEENGELVIRFEYRPATLSDWPEDQRAGKTKPPAQKDLIAAATKQVLAVKAASLAPWIAELGKLHVKSDGERADYSRLEAHLRRYTARNTFDYFIHKDLGTFLRRELDFYIKNEVMHLDDVESETAPKVEQYLSKIKVIRKIAGKIIAFLAQLEDFQKKLWLKKKFVVETQYCITLDRIPEEFYPEIVANDAQREEWVRLFAIDEIKGDLAKQGYNTPLKPPFLKMHPTLGLDTRHFNADFTARLLDALGDIEEQTDGVLFHSENFQALSFMQSQYRDRLKCIYIDPPYNSNTSEIAYKNTFKHSSWLSLMDSRLALSSQLMMDDGSHIVAIDENEQEVLGQLLALQFPSCDKVCVVVVHNKKGIQGDYFSYNHEYAFFCISPGLSETHGTPVPEENWEYSNLRKWGRESARSTAKNCFYPVFVKNGVIVGFGEVCADDYHPIACNVIEADRVAIYPIDDGGTERKWRYARNTVEAILPVLRVHTTRAGEVQVHKAVSEKPVKTVWDDSKYIAGDYGTKWLSDLGVKISEDIYPKSIHTVTDSIHAVSDCHSYILDYFAGSGTTGHAVINLNREDGGRRKFILVEMGDYFDTVLLPRIKKVTFTPEWKDGKPKHLATREEAERSPRIVKVIRLESYEDALNNLETRRTKVQQSLLDAPEAQGADKLREQYLLRYLLDVETRGSQSLLNVGAFSDPTAYKLKVKRPGSDESREVTVDLPETFNWLIGLTVRHIGAPHAFSARFERDAEGRLRLKGRIKLEAGGPWWFRTVSGTTPDGRRALVIWRKRPGGETTEGIEQDNLVLDEWFKQQGYSSKDSEFDLIWVNGDNNLENLKAPDDTWKVRLIEEDFHRLMFDTEGA